MGSISRGKVTAGRVVLPAAFRKEMGIKEGSEVVFSRTEHGIEIRTLTEVVRSVQSRFAPFIQSGVSVVDDLIRDRREAAERE